MHTFRTIRLHIKKNHPRLYEKVRGKLFGTYSALYAKRRNGFSKESTARVNHEGITFSIVLDPTNGFVDTEIYTHGVYEPDILTVIKHHLKSGDTFVDIGTNIGQHSLFAGKIVGENGSVISFEPIPQIVSQFKKSIALNTPNSQHVVHNLACGDTPAVLQLHIKAGNTGGSGFHHKVTDSDTIPVAVVKADDYLLTESRVDFIKIDTEGHELEALRGLIQTLGKYFPVVLTEFSPSFWREGEAEDKTREFFSILHQNNYEIYDLEDGYRKISDPISWYTSFTKIQTNLLCLPTKS